MIQETASIGTNCYNILLCHSSFFYKPEKNFYYFVDVNYCPCKQFENNFEMNLEVLFFSKLFLEIRIVSYLYAEEVP